jgi:hypothetical protein
MSYHHIHKIQAVPWETAGPHASARERRHCCVPVVLHMLAGAPTRHGCLLAQLSRFDVQQHEHGHSWEAVPTVG